MKLSENTLIPVSFIAVIAGGIFWLSSLWFQTQSNAQAISSIEDKTAKSQDRDQSFREEVLERLTRIEQSIKARR